jgi:uncharacterized membrane protein
MSKSRIEAFSDGVIAILMTIMVFDLKPPAGMDYMALQSLGPLLFSYALSFLYLGIYWNNHHHLFQAARRINGLVMWANLHLLFWLSLLPFTTNWLRTSDSAPLPTAIYGGVLLLAGLAFLVLQYSLVRIDADDSPLRTALGSDVKGKVSLLCYSLGIGVSNYEPKAALALYTLVALFWLIPDSRIESQIEHPKSKSATG